MGKLTRRNFFAGAGAISTLAALPGIKGEESAQQTEWPGGDAENAAFRLSLLPREGLVNTRLVHLDSGIVLADADYSYSFGRPEFQAARIGKSDDGGVTIYLKGTALGGGLEIEQEFRLPNAKPWMEEEISVVNSGAVPLNLSDVRCGFVLPLPLADSKVSGPWKDFKFTAIPFRREYQGNKSQYFTFTLDQILTEEFRSELITYDTRVSGNYASEGWAWTDGSRGFLITKYGQEGMEWSIVDRVPLGKERAGLRWGGVGVYLGEPVHGAWLAPGEAFHFGVTRLSAYEGGMQEGFYTFRQEMAERGHGCPRSFNPPVHWNELYDNKLWWLPNEEQGDPLMRKKYYTLADMKEEAAKAKAIGCEALYLDPGWDTKFGSKIWDEARLGTCKSFAEMLRQEYGLKLSLHTPLSGWCDPTGYSPEMYRVDRFGQRLTWERSKGFDSPICGASRQYLEETARRLNVLASDGAGFFMFDGNNYHGECWDPKHGHRVPALHQEHVEGMDRLARMVHAEHPDVLVEMHFPTPNYYGHGKALEKLGNSQALGFDSVWGFELMWGPMEDLISGHAIALYYYSLAYGLPIYLHIDLRKDNAHALMFWWNASTCRHLGIGGTHKDPTARQAHKEGMAAYRRLEAFFKAGAFFGLDETVHIHIHPTEQAAVVNCFNLEDRTVTRRIAFEPGKFGLDAGASYEVKGAPAHKDGNRYSIDVEILAYGHVLLELRKST
jgi:hypothetical protein